MNGVITFSDKLSETQIHHHGSMSTQPTIEEIIEGHLRQIMEHCDSVQILASIHDPVNQVTSSVFTGAGNWFSRQGMAESFLKTDNARHIAHEMPRPEPPPDESEEWKS